MEIFPPYWRSVRGIYRHLWILLKKQSRGAWSFTSCAPEQTVEQTVDMLVIWDAMVLNVTYL